jgi:hypothetical protein
MVFTHSSLRCQSADFEFATDKMHGNHEYLPKELDQDLRAERSQRNPMGLGSGTALQKS